VLFANKEWFKAIGGFELRGLRDVRDVRDVIIGGGCEGYDSGRG